MNFTFLIDAAAVVLSLVFFVVGSISDIKTREVDDKIWLTYGSLGTALTVLRLILDPSRLMLTGVSVAIVLLISIGLVYFGLTGGADAKAIICLGLTLPLPPNSLQPLLGFVHPFFPIVVVMMGFICSGLTALWFGMRNTALYMKVGRRMFAGLEDESNWRKALAFLSGYPTRVSNLKSKLYLYPIEEVTRSGARRSMKRHFRFFVDAETDRDELVSKFIRAVGRPRGGRTVWVTPGLPMLLFILVGLIVALVIGDPIFTTIVSSILH
jgi:preflagellin peptidase FlaK